MCDVCLSELVLRQEQEEYQREGIEWTNIEYFNNKVRQIRLMKNTKSIVENQISNAFFPQLQ